MTVRIIMAPLACAGHMASLGSMMQMVGYSAFFNPITGASVEANNQAIHALTGIPQVRNPLLFGLICPISGLHEMGAALWQQAAHCAQWQLQAWGLCLLRKARG